MPESDKDRQARSRNGLYLLNMVEGIGPSPDCKSTRLPIWVNWHSEKRSTIQAFTYQLVNVAVRTIRSKSLFPWQNVRELKADGTRPTNIAKALKIGRASCTACSLKTGWLLATNRPWRDLHSLRSTCWRPRADFPHSCWLCSCATKSFGVYCRHSRLTAGPSQYRLFAGRSNVLRNGDRARAPL